jgi:predicted XRE-type DNA-binding protein
MSTERDADESAVIDSTGDVFKDLGLEMSEEDLLKVVIARAISRVIVGGGYTQKKAAQIMGLDQPKVSKLLRGRLKEFSADRLIDCLLALGYDIEVKYKKSRASDRGKIRLVAA